MILTPLGNGRSDSWRIKKATFGDSEWKRNGRYKPHTWFHRHVSSQRQGTEGLPFSPSFRLPQTWSFSKMWSCYSFRGNAPSPSSSLGLTPELTVLTVWSVHLVTTLGLSCECSFHLISAIVSQFFPPPAPQALDLFIWIRTKSFWREWLF